MYRVTVTDPETKKVIRARHFTTKRKAEKYEDDQYAYNPLAFKYDFEIRKIKGE